MVHTHNSHLELGQEHKQQTSLQLAEGPHQLESLNEIDETKICNV
jgi:hypothetical protein